MTPVPLNAVTTQILDLLNAGRPVPQVVEIGTYRGAWNAADVRNVIASYLAGPPPPKPRRERVERAKLTPGPASPWVPPSIRTTVRQPRLTTPEADILSWLCRGASNRQMAQRLALTEATVERRVLAVLSKLGVPTRNQAVALAMSRQIQVMVQDMVAA